MNNIKSLIEGYMNGNAWEELCVECYRIRYQSDNYTPLPAAHCGDAGIEGFTNKGIVHQCYCPERNFSDKELYEHQRDKLTTDIEKLKKNGLKLKALGVPPIVEWHFNIPEYKDTRIVSHVNNKCKEIIEAKKSDPSKYSHIDDSFSIAIKTAEDLLPEISQIIRTSITDKKINMIFDHPNEIDWSKCDSVKVSNVRRKIKAVMLVDENDVNLNKVVDIFLGYYINGLEIMNNLRVNFPEIYEDIVRLENNYKHEVSIKTLMNTDKTMNYTLFSSILEEFHLKLSQDFSHSFTEASITELKNDLVASWLADCSMEFRG